MINDVLFEQRDSVAVITVNRPDKLNALNSEVLDQLADIMAFVARNSSLRCLVITGAGSKAFVAGADIAELSACDSHSGRFFALKGQAVFNSIEQIGIPVIAAINGFALGGGCELAMACHIRLAADNARFGQPEVNLGIIPGFGGTQRLPRLVGKAKAFELILSGDNITASQALSIGLVNHVVPAAELMATALELAEKLASKAPLALRGCIEAVQLADATSLHDGLTAEASIFSRTCGTSDFAEGTQAFLEKRLPQFTGQ